MMKTLVLVFLVYICSMELVGFAWAEEVEFSSESEGKLFAKEDNPKEIHKRAVKNKDLKNPLYLFQKYDRNFIMNKI